MLDTTTAKQYLKDFDFKPLFIKELGWDRHDASLDVTVDGQNFRLAAVAQKRGMAAFVFQADGSLPDYALRRKIERQVTRSAHEHIVIFIDKHKTLQIWQWVKREPGKPTACREHHYRKSQSGEALIQKLSNIAFSLEEEEQLSLIDVTIRARAGFDVEKVTKKFYDQFKTEHDAFLRFLKGIPDDELQRWYASVMINRLMFIYFIQKKGFLNNDRDYLRNKLKESKQRGKDKYYMEFLCPLFFDGFASKEEERSASVNKLLGFVPYLNGGLFLKHQIEEAHGKTIQVADAAFQKIFDFFDQYQWHLDERPTRHDNEINPDILGYIFEKYINQKQMGAYYSKEDITEYISENTILPFLFDEARKKCKIAFEGERSVWKLLQNDPDRYIYEAVKYGATKPYPKEIATGLKVVSKRTEWNKPAPEEYALPTEIWREVVARRTRYEEVKSKLVKGEINNINDLITHNLNIRQFAQDVIENCEGPDLLRSFWHTVVGRVPEKSNEKFEQGITILDPTCGSGAFLFAALNILEPFYEACLDRMEVFIDELDRQEAKPHPEKYSDFRKVLKRIDEHPSRRYFVLKSIIINNLFGVDIMEEATEICKLRLFLKLVAQIEDSKKIEPLPDIDFNIRTGNTLVGFATLEEAERTISSKLDFGDTMRQISDASEDLDRLFKLFREQQTKLGGTVTAADKSALQNGLSNLEDKLNRHLARDFGVGTKNGPVFDAWQKSHQPFHWFVNFYGIMNKGGFDVIIGNPPWVEYAKVKQIYQPNNIATLDCNNLWAFVVERSLVLQNISGTIGLIVPMSLVCTERMTSIQKVVRTSGICWLTNIESDSNPGQLFDGVKQNVTILLQKKNSAPRINTSRLLRFFQEYRDFVLSSIEFEEFETNPLPFGFPKVGSGIEHRILDKLFQKQPLVVHMISASRKPILVHRIAHYYIKCMDFVPYFRSDRDGIKKSEDYKEYLFAEPHGQYVAAINSSTFYFYWQVFFDAFKAGKFCVESFPFGVPDQPSIRSDLNKLAQDLMEDLKANSSRLTATYEATGDVEYDQFYPRRSKLLIDGIDKVLAKHYGFTEEELDFIINYDIKYRMGKDSTEEVGEQ